MESRTISRWILGILFLAVAGLFLGGCATLGEKQKPTLVPTERGTVVYKDKYEFKRPPQGALMRNLTGGDFEFGFLTLDEGEFPSQTTFFYDEEPYGSSLDLETRAIQYSSLFLAGRGMSMDIKKMEKAEVAGKPALAIYLEGENPYRNEKARSTVYLIKTGDYVVSLVCTQWRPMKGTFNPKAFEDFEAFVTSFKFLKSIFYEEIEEKIKRLKV